MRQYVRIFTDMPQLKCEFCGKNLLDDKNNGNFIVFRETDEGKKYKSIRYACKEHDSIVTSNAKKEGLQDAGWDDLDDLLIPTIWIKKLMAFVNEMYESRELVSDEYFCDVKQMFLNTFPYVARQMSQKELERISALLQIEF